MAMLWKIVITCADDNFSSSSEGMPKSELMEVLPVLLKPSMFGNGNFTFTIEPIKDNEE